MKIAPLKASDPWYRRIVGNEQVHTDALSAVPIESTVEMELVELLHGGPEENYRPYLHLRGELTEAKPAVELPYGVSELAMRRGSGLTVDAFYDFTQEQLNDLVSKGYFTAAFRVPDEMSGIPWTLPGKADFLVVAPDLSDEPPLVFMNVHHQTGMEFDESNSGYQLAAYFPDYSAEAQELIVNDLDTVGPERGGSGLDVFDDVELPAPDMFAEPVDGDVESVRSQVPDGVFSRLVSEIQAQEPEQEIEPDSADEDAEASHGSAWDVYMSRISPGVEQVLAGRAATEQTIETASGSDYDLETAIASSTEQAQASADAFLDVLGDEQAEPELTPINKQLEEISEDEHLKAAKRRASSLRAELTADEGDALEDEAQSAL